MCAGKSPEETSTFNINHMQGKLFSYKTDLADRVGFHPSMFSAHGKILLHKHA